MKIAYIGEHHPTEGTYYRQRITVNRVEFNAINNVLQNRYTWTEKSVRMNHIMTTAQADILCYGYPLDPTQNKHYLKLTQLYTIRAAFPNKRITDNNTILIVKD